MSGRKEFTGRLTVRPKPAKKRNTGALTTLDFNRIQEHSNKLMSDRHGVEFHGSWGGRKK